MQNEMRINEESVLAKTVLDDVVSDNLADITTESTEAALDQFFAEGILKDLPMIGIAVKLAKVGFGIREYLFTKKLIKLLRELKSVPSKRRAEFLVKLENDIKYQYKVGERLLMIVDQLDDMDKPAIIGRLFKAAMNEFINYEMFLRLSSIVQKAFLPDLLLIKDSPFALVSETQNEIYLNLGLLSVAIDPDGNNRLKKLYEGSSKADMQFPTLLYKKNKTCDALIKYGLWESPNRGYLQKDNNLK